MSFRNDNNKHLAWQFHCQTNSALIKKLELPIWVFKNETNFKDFVTNGKTQDARNKIYDFDILKNKKPKMFWDLFGFINDYFEMDSDNFNAFESSRIEK